MKCAFALQCGCDLDGTAAEAVVVSPVGISSTSWTVSKPCFGYFPLLFTVLLGLSIYL